MELLSLLKEGEGGSYFFFSQRKGHGVQGSLHVNITEVPGPQKGLEGARGVHVDRATQK